MIPTLQQVYDDTRKLCGDSEIAGGQRWLNSVLRSDLQASYSDFFKTCEIRKIPRTKKKIYFILEPYTATWKPIAAQKKGDCSVTVCDGAGATLAQYDPDDAPPSSDECRYNMCSPNGVVKMNEANGMPCSKGTCKGGVCSCDLLTVAAACAGVCGPAPDGCGGTYVCNECPYGCTYVKTITACEAYQDCWIPMIQIDNGPPGCNKQTCHCEHFSDGTLVLSGCTVPNGSLPSGYQPLNGSPGSYCAEPPGKFYDYCPDVCGGTCDSPCP